ncbi:MAG: hypothetical protein JWL63_3401 [Rhodocyclales bacterium]|nr:hypothetical protein [Rhodocyclales bacterium]
MVGSAMTLEANQGSPFSYLQVHILDGVARNGVVIHLNLESSAQCLMLFETIEELSRFSWR